MRLKAVTWFLFALTAFLLLGWPFIVGLPPKGASKPVIKQYAIRAEMHMFVLVAAFMGTAVCAALVVRQTRQEYLRDSAQNLKTLIEGTLEDHRKTSGSTDEPS